MTIRNELAASAVLLLAVAGADARSPESDLAAPGAPLYERAVKESVITLMSKQEQAVLDAQGRPPSPGPDYFWCKNCKTYHKRKTPASAQKPAVAQRPGAATAARPPSPGPDYYWCENCKTYHKRQAPAPAQQPGASPAAPHAHAAPPAVGTVADQAPGADYYYCENCKTYHRRKPAAQQSVEDLIVGGATNSPNLSPLISQ
jgi:hypothetical protein